MLWVDMLEATSLAALGLPLLAMLLLGTTMLCADTLSERRVQLLLSRTFLASFALTLVSVATMALGGISRHVIDLGPLVAVGSYHLQVALLLDPLAMLMLTLDFLLCGLVGMFSARYLHRDEGFHRFYLMLLMLTLGVEFVAVGGGFDLVFIGWELLGLSSALLIGFFYRRRGPVENAFRAYAVYRVTDIGLLSAVILLHHAVGSVAVLQSVSSAHTLPAATSLLIGAMFVFGAMGKGGIVPLTGWLPRAMEGPTASSAIFYGALSVHASPFLLLRIYPILEQHLELRIAIGALGALTALHASMVGRVQTDVKAGLGYASAAQVGLIWIWIALGWHELAMVHMAGHAIARAWQILRAPSFIQERRALEGRYDARLVHDHHVERAMPIGLRRTLYHLALERWYLDELLVLAISPVRRALLALDGFDERLTRWLNGEEAGRALDTAGHEAELPAHVNPMVANTQKELR